MYTCIYTHVIKNNLRKTQLWGKSLPAGGRSSKNLDWILDWILDLIILCNWTVLTLASGNFLHVMCMLHVTFMHVKRNMHVTVL